VNDGVPPTQPDQIIFDPLYTNFWTDHTGEVVLGALVVNVKVPDTAPNEVLSTTIEKVVELITVAVKLPLTATQLPVPPLIVTIGRELVSNPCPPLTVMTTGDAFVAEAIEIDGDTGWVDAALHRYSKLSPLYPKMNWYPAEGDFCEIITSF